MTTLRKKMAWKEFGAQKAGASSSRLRSSKMI
jgi:hypothetical protein